ncbi:MAG: DUF721 domain-containing protein [Gammaproteobacteria bacterium]|nr:DUF721 domain-containing protein [Gammaproteobacteria bacterium]
MDKQAHKTIQQITDDSQQLGSVLGKAQQIADLNRGLNIFFPDDLRNHCQIINLQQSQLTVAADNAAWATQLRYQVNTVLDGIKTVMPEIRSLKIITQQPDAVVKAKPMVERTLSEEAAEHLQATAKTVTNPELKAVLEKLASRKKS